MSFSVEQSGSVTVVRVAENITFVNQKDFLAVWDRIVADAGRAAVLDLSEISYIGSMAIGLVAKVFNQLKGAGIRMVAVRPEKDEVFQVFKITRLVDLIPFHDTKRGALDTLGVDSGEYATIVLEEADPVESKIKKLEDKDPEVRRYTAWALGLLGDQRAVAALEGILADPDSRVRQAAADSLEKLTGQRYPVSAE